MVDLTGVFRISDEEIEQLVEQELTHPHYTIAMDRAKVMNTWFVSEPDEFAHIDGDLFRDKSYVIQRSNLESDSDYQRKINRMRLFPLEAKFFQAQKRVFDQNNVHREYPADFTEDDKEFWDWKVGNYDDQGASANEFYRDKAMFIKEVLGFGAVVCDVMVDSDGNTVTHKNKPIPYVFALRPHEVLNYKQRNGHLIYLISKQKFSKPAEPKKVYYRFTCYTEDRIRVYEKEGNAGSKELIVDIENPFGKVPAVLLKGESDSNSGFSIGKPRRYNLKGLYLSMSELFYDLQQASELYGHPIPVMPKSIAMANAGIKDDEKYNANTIKEQVGSTIVIPDDMELPNNLFYQADMQGLQHLTNLIFSQLLPFVFNLAMIRDKSVVKSNVSGNAKFLDNVEEQGLLSQTAMDMEEIESQVNQLMAHVRGEEPIKSTYTKHYDLSSANEIFSDITEGMQYGALPKNLLMALIEDYMRKRSYKEEQISEVLSELEDIELLRSPEQQMQQQFTQDEQEEE